MLPINETPRWPLRLRQLGTDARGDPVWLGKTEHGNYCVIEGQGGVTVLGPQDHALDYAATILEPESKAATRFWAYPR